jgi:hypothetical protein
MNIIQQGTADISMVQVEYLLRNCTKKGSKASGSTFSRKKYAERTEHTLPPPPRISRSYSGNAALILTHQDLKGREGRHTWISATSRPATSESYAERQMQSSTTSHGYLGDETHDVQSIAGSARRDVFDLSFDRLQAVNTTELLELIRRARCQGVGIVSALPLSALDIFILAVSRHPPSVIPPLCLTEVSLVLLTVTYTVLTSS